jgi:GGDEF domain-containing protein
VRYATDTPPVLQFDARTGLFNSTFLEARTEEEMSRAIRLGKEVFLVTLHHPGRGDRLAEWLRHHVRSYDVVGVIQCGLFGVLMLETDRKGCERMLDRARAGVGEGLRSGIAQFPEGGVGYATLLRSAIEDMVDVRKADLVAA